MSPIHSISASLARRAPRVNRWGTLWSPTTLPVDRPDRFDTRSVPTVAAAAAGSLAGRAPVLRDLPGDLNTPEAVEHVNALRHHAHAGKRVKRSDFFHYNKVSDDNSLKLYTDREYFTDALLPMIEGAQDSIHMAFLDIDGGELAQHITDSLIAKKAENPDMEIRILTDGLGSYNFFPWSRPMRNIRRLRQAGVEVVINNVMRDGLEHRKLLLVDGKEACWGAACLADRYFGNEDYWKAFKSIPLDERPAARSEIFSPGESSPFEITPELKRPEFHDFGMKVSGSSVDGLQAAFMQSWLQHDRRLNPEMSDADFAKRYFRAGTSDGKDKGTKVKMVHSVPGGDSQFRQSALAVVDGATKTLDVNFPYILIPEFLEHLKAAAARGVKIRLLTLSEEGTDLKICWRITRTWYPELFAAGDVEIHEHDAYSHCKFMVADKRLVFTSSGNAEWQSWEWANDSSALVDSPAFAAEVERKIFAEDMSPERARVVTPEEVAARSWRVKVLGALSNAVSWLFQTPRFRMRPRRKILNSVS
ncbi:MAG: phospholipase D-like domain-containing protein [Myxococcota bacterium]|nr:phospholipase D-like domain-containing protein [Myxococcota bacterium]